MENGPDAAIRTAISENESLKEAAQEQNLECVAVATRFWSQKSPHYPKPELRL